ncbi:MAG TPA: PAS domain S-box protein [Hanamia sp.]|nr:PAS domain S-box protein [Hanamia sp.]
MSFATKRKVPVFLLGGGEMGELIRNFDWENTPLGNPKNWEQSLKTCVRIMLSSRQPIWIGWGKDLIKLYNDPYKSIAGGKHPDALGQPASVVWKEIWPNIQPLLHKVMEEGEGTYSESQLLIMDRNGYLEETYYTFSFTPIPGNDGATAGMFCANHDDTSRVINDRALETLGKLGKISYNDKKLEDIYKKTTAILAENNKDFPFACFYKIEDDVAKMVARAGNESDYDFLPQTINTKEPNNDTWNICKAIENNEVVISFNKGRRPNLPKGFWDIVPEQILHIPFCFLNETCPNAILTIGLNPYRQFDAAYQCFIELVRDQIILDINNMHAFEQERKRVEAFAEARQKIEESEQKYRELVTSLPVAVYTCNAEGKILFFNEVAEKLWGYTPDIEDESLRYCAWHRLLDADGTSIPPYQTSMAKSLKTGKVFRNVEALAERPNREQFYASININPLFDEEGEIKGAINIFQDITNIKQAEISVRESKERYKNLIQGLPVAFYTTNQDGIITLYNQAASELWGRHPQIGKDKWCGSWKIFEADGITEVPLDQCPMAICLKEKRKVIVSNYFIVERPDGTRRFFEPFAEPMYNLQGQMIGATNTLIDVTDSKKAEADNAKLAAIVQSSDDAIISKTVHGIITSWNQSAEKMFGYTEAEMIGESITKIIPTERLNEEAYILDNIKRGKAVNHFETQRLHKNGNLVNISLTVSPVKDGKGNILGASKIARDITPQIESRKQLEASEEKLSLELDGTRKLQSISTRLIQEDKVTNLYEQLVNAAIELMHSDMGSIQMYHPEKNQLQLMGWKGFHPESAKFWKWVTADSKSSCGMALENNQRIIIPDIDLDEAMAGTEDLYFSQLSGIKAVQSTPLISRNGNIVGMISTHWSKPYQPTESELRLFDVLARQAADLIERKKVEEKLEISERRFRSLAESLPQLVWMTDEKGKHEFVSKRWVEYCGIHCDSMEKWKTVVHPDDFKNITELWRTSIATGKMYHGEVRIKSKSGDYRWHAVVGEPVFENENKIVKWVGAFTDIDFMKKEQQRKDAFLSMASHELRTPVTTIKAYNEIAIMMLEEKGDEAITGIQKKLGRQVNKLTTLISDLLDNIRVEKGKLLYTEASYNFISLVKETVNDMQKINPGRRITYQPQQQQALLYGDANKIEQVINNLITNAIKYSGADDEVIVTDKVKKDGIQLSVTDFGIGIPAEDKSHVFEQFYRVEGNNQSTYPGMGVGLYICEEIIKRHKGRIWFESTVGKGSTFHIWLPVDYSQIDSKG